MQHHHYILSLCQSLAKSGKTPSVALIKSQASHPLPLPDILAVLQKWRKDPNIVHTNAAPVAPNVLSAEQRLTRLESRVEKMEKLLQQVLTELKQPPYSG
ncbi:hypothetical protein [Lacimicrobium alkaliphilum]|uniref:KfrA N-terminal DNA-binding domain-containing protein n=1 Tax=Lacimicrobium alkaliphilum TaxID=1526571 RepID=A0ABQ1REB2_9ALTE|nr:hypothetical protein [Lacimicrobium alkaliphilum]GGD66947.1 hypothetical protein GCM10011357_22680 [Lacimicrobium alkaliphilum]